MNKVITLLITVIAVGALIGCGRDRMNSGGDTTISNEYIIIEAYSYPSGELSREEYEKGKNHYTVSSEGEVVDKDGKSIKLSEEDLDRIAELHSLIYEHKAKEKEHLIFDYPSYEVEAHWNGKTVTMSSNANSQCEEVEEVLRIIWTYYD